MRWRKIPVKQLVARRREWSPGDEDRPRYHCVRHKPGEWGWVVEMEIEDDGAILLLLSTGDGIRYRDPNVEVDAIECLGVTTISTMEDGTTVVETDGRVMGGLP